MTLLLWTLALYVAASVVVAAVLAFLNGLPWRQPVLSRPEDLAPRAEAVRFRAQDGVELAGYWAPPVADRPVVLVQAGKRATRDHMLPWARVLAEAGYGVLTFDWRAQGESEGWILTYGAQGPEDTQGALDFLAGRPDAAGRPVGIYACSMGAANVAMAAPLLPDSVRCLVLDSPYGDLGRMTHDRLRYLGPLRWIPWWAIAGISRVLLGYATHKIRPEVSLAAFAPRPVYVMHGDADTVVPYDEGVRLHAAYPGPKRFFTDAGTDHVDARSTDTRGWMARVAGFFHEHLDGAPGVEEVLARTPERLDETACWESFRTRVQEEIERTLETGAPELEG